MTSIRLHRNILIWLALLFFYTAHAAEMLYGRVVGVHDGDTITLLMDGNHPIKVRLAQIDAPESKQPFGNQSKKSLSDMVFNKTIRVEKETIDKYGRTVGTLFVGDLDVNKEQVKRGMAWVYPKYAHDVALALCSVASVSSINSFLVEYKIHEYSAPSAMVIFLLLIEIYDKFIWKYVSLVGLSSIPDINGIWEGSLTKNNGDSFPVTLHIHQTWRQI